MSSATHASFVLAVLLGLFAIGSALDCYVCSNSGNCVDSFANKGIAVESNCTSCTKMKSTSSTMDRGRLPDTLHPIHYNVEIRGDLTGPAPPFPFDGQVEIWFRCDTATDVVVLNNDELIVDGASVQLSVASGSPVQAPEPVIASFSIDPDLEFQYANLTAPLVVGAHYYYVCSFNGTMAPPGIGFHWDVYDKNGTLRYIAATQFQMNYGRRAFPGFDEPSFKSTFNITLVHQNDLQTLGNTPLLRTEDRGNGWTAETYEQSPVMALYHLAWAFHDFGYVETFTKSGTRVRIYVRDEVMPLVGFANQVVAPTNDWFENYTGIAYPISKIDHIGIPNKGGAMENWGLVIYGEFTLAYQEGEDYITQKRLVLQIINHEVAHMWFGNLVTCHWWDDAWLNEGFASYFQYQSAKEILGWPWEDFHWIYSQQNMLDYDSRNTSVPIRRPDVDSPFNAGSAFSTITYNKGGCVGRMLDAILGYDGMQRAINLYLTRHSYGNARTDDLWNAMSEQAAIDGVTNPDGSYLDFKQRFDPYVEQMGYPLIRFNHSSQRGDFTQEHFLHPQNQTVNQESQFGYVWQVPISFHTETSQYPETGVKYWLTGASGGTADGFPPGIGNWVVLNPGARYFYRVLYDSQNWANIVKQLVTDSSVISPENRAGFIDDAFVLARGGHIGFTRGLDATRHLGSDIELIPWEVFVVHLDFPSLLISQYPTTNARYINYMLQIVNPVYETLGWADMPGEIEEYHGALRAIIISVACTYGNSACLLESLQQFRIWQNNPLINNIAPDNRATVYCAAVRGGTPADWNWAYSRMKQSTSAREESQLMYALGCTKYNDTLNQFLQYTLDPSEIAPLDRIDAIDSLIQGNTGRDLVWEYLKANFTTTPWSYPDKIDALQGCAATFANDVQYQELQNFIATYPPQNQGEQDDYNIALGLVEVNMDWSNRNMNEVDQWLQTYVTPSKADINPDRCESCMRLRTRAERELRMNFERTINNLPPKRGYYLNIPK